MPLIEWDRSLAIGVPEIDEQHRTFLRMANELHDALVAGTFSHYLDARQKAVEQLQEYVVRHFAAEEDFMARAGYPGLEAHRALHEAFAVRVREFTRSLAEGNPVLGSELMASMIHWFRDHIAQEDQKLHR